ncbi:unnamed protein product [Phytophthora fragariaefolia]|uniref:Unnamed protein product n=1 Tax=Phytophthora fragariaefolia TaxID=1490495 RepID=A0A9W6X9U9_9STRA|nr:unnamed protein product [Phytophthora fragariaefolia]
MRAVKARHRTLKNEFVPDVASLFRANLKMDLSVDDCYARIFRYYEDFNGIVENNGLQDLIGAREEDDASTVGGAGYKNRMRARCRPLAARYLAPAGSVQVNGLLEVHYLSDTGADESVIPRSGVEALAFVQPTLQIETLTSPVKLEMAAGRRLMCTEEDSLDLELSIIAGSVSMRSVPCLIFGGGGDELLLGRDALEPSPGKAVLCFLFPGHSHNVADRVIACSRNATQGLNLYTPMYLLKELNKRVTIWPEWDKSSPTQSSDLLWTRAAPKRRLPEEAIEDIGESNDGSGVSDRCVGTAWEPSPTPTAPDSAEEELPSGDGSSNATSSVSDGSTDIPVVSPPPQQIEFSSWDILEEYMSNYQAQTLQVSVALLSSY